MAEDHSPPGQKEPIKIKHHGRSRWEVDYADMIQTEDQQDWVQSPYILDLLEKGWEPFAVTNMFKPLDNGGYSFAERIWFRRKVNA